MDRRKRPLVCRLHNDVDCAAEPSEKEQQASYGNVSELATKHSRNVGLTNSDELRCLALSKFLGADHILHAGDELSLEQVGFGVFDLKVRYGPDAKRKGARCGALTAGVGSLN